jgi:[CysO sulfur-carrier protein]-S-L-cysteine hydrolase
MRIAPDLLDQIVEHARRDAPDECCGVVASRDGVAEEAHALENLAHSPLRFEVDGLELNAVMTRVEDAGGEIGAIYHSHTRSAPEPSQTDINFAAGWPGTEWIIVGLRGDEPEVRSWLIEDGQVTEVPLEVEAPAG